jgi:hypothetical protein
MQPVSPHYYHPRVDYSTKLTDIPSLEWQSKTREVIAADNVSSGSIVQVLSEHPFLKECYSKYAVENYSVSEHTERVLGLAQKYRTSFEEDVAKAVSWDEFLLFLALHDIGKGIAQENESFVFGTKFSFKEGELETTQQILTKVMEMLRVPSHKIRLFCEMLRYDTQGLYLTGDIELEEAFDNILEMAKNSQQDPRVFYRIFRAYHILDAASYPSLSQFFEFASGLKYNCIYVDMDEKLADALEQAEAGRIFFEKCVLRVQGEEDSTALHHDFLNHLPQLLKFLETMHKEMLAYPEKQETYQGIKRGFRNILLYLARSSQDLNTLQSLYVSSLTCVLGRRKLHQPVDYKLDLFFDHISDIKGLIDLRDKLIHFRKDYLCRYSLDKVENFVREEMNRKKVKDHIDLGRDALVLLRITYLHGTHAAILPILQRTGMHLMPFDRLRHEYITPLCVGSAAKGNNQYRMSGTSLDHAMEVYSYAAEENFSPIPSQEEQVICQFLSFVQECLNGRQSLFAGRDLSQEWTRLAQAILRLRALDPEQYRMHQSRLSEAVQLIGSEWRNHSRINTPKMEQCIRHLNIAVDEDLIIPQGITNALSHPYGMVLASTTLHTMTSNAQDPSDRNAQKASLLGKDIQIIFTAEKNIDRLNLFLEENRLKGKVTLIDLHSLLNAIELHQLASPYFADIASKEKLVSLSPGIPRKIQSAPSETTTSQKIQPDVSTYSYWSAGLAVVTAMAFIFARGILKR